MDGAIVMAGMYLCYQCDAGCHDECYGCDCGDTGCCGTEEATD